MFSSWKYYCFLLILCAFTLASLYFTPELVAFLLVVCFVGVSVALILRVLFGMTLQARQQHHSLLAMIREQNAAHAVKFGENEARVRQLGGLVREAERSVAGLGELQRVKFGENEARVRRLGGLVREAERSVAGLGEDIKTLRSSLSSDEVRRQATVELKLKILNDLAMVRELLEKPDIDSPDTHEPVWTLE
ncbi:hypothetical protein [Arthrobacter sp. UYP6]|uniref:hypothetical protein n=1 Tax=Arthrobacter sp. UYP6 TaxID=1756378 RepID=UPI0033972EE3